MSETPAAPCHPCIVQRLRLHGALDVAFAAIYAYCGFWLVEARRLPFQVALGALILVMVAAGAALVLRLRFARVLALAASFALLTFCAVVVALMLASAAYLKGIYGGVGQGMAIVGVLVASLVVAFCGLLPIFQIKMLFEEDVKNLLSRRS